MLFEVLLDGKLTWNFSLLAFLLSVVLLYLLLLKRSTWSKPTYHRILLFVIGIGLLYLMTGSPLTPIFHLSFSTHMLQMSIIYFIIPPIILCGIPEAMFQQLLEILKNKRIGTLRLPPKISLYAFAVLFLLYHLPVILQTLIQHMYLQNSYLLVLFILSFGMWWPIVSPDPKQLLYKERLKRYTFLSGVMIMPACVLFILSALFAEGNNPFLTQLTVHLCLPASSNFTAALLPPPFNTKSDQVIAGILMMALHKLGLIMTIKLRNKMMHQKKASLPASHSAS